jgi:hypothetical protein
MSFVECSVSLYMHNGIVPWLRLLILLCLFMLLLSSSWLILGPGPVDVAYTCRYDLLPIRFFRQDVLEPVGLP